ncbi:2-amino-4-hydroxy-6-hydroxymethyldihydropteridine diphosphokinase [Petroclostridium sp. X23]|uniref:2-amino-4-hydroxy-6- hydroxymethyldihydropteridine diphosphokinase n=1 Tax=Petroclostridium sp. X23 TaxID=3045146 RepID=UPI0024ACEB44|nr:2-amino-4-hydroxy-6-hydroxymethyldihydropteridine diphosphokinase [Petroclostridium sp. X23]WHH60227.1 2-amino-4-hydroxy-6-hydroxymethyldihydropteridine diphosphokinase [Petroclostridium sp. X23]
MNGNQVISYIGLGSNIGDRKANLDRAIDMFRELNGIEVTAVSSYYNTAPVGYTEQPDFLNAVIELRITLPVSRLLEVCRDIEKSLKRERTIRWGPRTIDLDILLYGDVMVNQESLTVPHPRMHERDFVMRPLNEIAPKAYHPVFKQTIDEMYRGMRNKSI